MILSFRMICGPRRRKRIPPYGTMDGQISNSPNTHDLVAGQFENRTHAKINCVPERVIQQPTLIQNLTGFRLRSSTPLPIEDRPVLIWEAAITKGASVATAPTIANGFMPSSCSWPAPTNLLSLGAFRHHETCGSYSAPRCRQRKTRRQRARTKVI